MSACCHLHAPGAHWLVFFCSLSPRAFFPLSGMLFPLIHFSGFLLLLIHLFTGHSLSLFGPLLRKMEPLPLSHFPASRSFVFIIYNSILPISAYREGHWSLEAVPLYSNIAYISRALTACQALIRALWPPYLINLSGYLASLLSSSLGGLYRESKKRIKDKPLVL